MIFLRLVLGVLCGIVATGPMSVMMVLLHRRLPDRERYPLPPRETTTKVVAQIVEPSDLAPTTRSALTWLAHFAFGGAAGGLYSFATKLLPGNPLPRGFLFGLIVWTVSYLGLLPGLHLLTPATEHPPRRNALMIGAHLMWGGFLASLYQILLSDFGRESTAFHTSPRRHRDVQSRLGEGTT